MTNVLSVIIPTFNRVQYLEEAIKSVENQSFKNFNIIVCDNASTDGTKELCIRLMQEGRIEYYRNKNNVGMVGNWYQGLINHSKTEYVMLLSDDDMLSNINYLESAISMLMDNNLILVHSNQKIINSVGAIIEKKIKVLPSIMCGNEFLKNFMTNRNYIFNLSTVIFKIDREIVGDILMNSKSMSVDFSMFLTLIQDQMIGYLPAISSSYRVHEGNESSANFIRWLDNSKFIDDIRYRGSLKAEKERLNKKLFRRYCKTRLVNRLYSNFSLETLASYISFCIRNDVICLIYLMNIKSVAYGIRNAFFSGSKL